MLSGAQEEDKKTLKLANEEKESDEEKKTGGNQDEAGEDQDEAGGQ